MIEINIWHAVKAALIGAAPFILVAIIYELFPKLKNNDSLEVDKKKDTLWTKEIIRWSTIYKIGGIAIIGYILVKIIFRLYGFPF